MNDPNKPCVGCGHCCLTGICVVGYTRMQATGPVVRCPYLIWAGGRYQCQLVLDNPKLFGKALHVGAGCCQTLNTWRSDVRFRG